MQQKYFTRKQGSVLLQEHGYVGCSLSTLNKLFASSSDQGAKVAKWSGSRPLYLADDLLVWAEARLSAQPKPLQHKTGPLDSRPSSAA
jgi:hypothetical protein